MGLMSRPQTRRHSVISTERREPAFEEQRGTSEMDKRLFKAYLKMIIARVSKLEGGENCASLTRKVS